MNEQKNEQKPKEEVKQKTKMKTATLIIVLVAIIAIGAITFIALYNGRRSTPATDTNPPPGNTNTPVPGPVLRDGWPVSGFGNPNEVNLVSISNQKGIVVAYENKVAVLNPSGTPFSNWPKQVDSDFQSTHTPVTGDINGDGMMEIVSEFFRQGVNGEPLVSKIYVWDTAGNQVSGWPKEITSESVNLPAVLADLNNDGKKEIVIITSYGSLPNVNSKVYVFKYDGSLLSGWPKEITEESFDIHPAVGNIDQEAYPEIVICGNNKIYAFHADGNNVSGWPIDFQCSEGIPPVIADFDTSDNFSQVVAVSYNNSISVWNGDGSLVSGWPKNLDIRPWSLIVTHFNPQFSYDSGNKLKDAFIKEAKAQIYFAPAILVGGAYTDQVSDAWDGDTKSWFFKEAKAQVNPNPASKIYAFTFDGQILSGWPIVFINNDVVYRLSAADIDKTGVKVFASMYNNETGSGKIYAYNTSGNIVSGWPIQVSENYPATPTFTDLDNNNYLEMVVRVMGKIYVWNLNTTFDPKKLLWPMFLHDTGHTNTYLLPSTLPTYPNML